MSQFHLPTIEEAQLKRWDDLRIFRKILDRKHNPKGDFVFFEGPPTANGKPGIHHVLSRTFKDAVLRFRTMQGYRVDRKAGWDTHGLPVELEVEKELHFKKKQDIEEYGIAEFNAKCRESVWKYLDLWQKMTRRVGFWVDLEQPYITYKNDYIETLWWLFKKIHANGLLSKGYRVTPHCPRCVTSLSSHELAQGYKDVEDPSVFVKFPLAGREKAFLLVWTTTPWTLPGNVAVAVGSDVIYVEAKLKETGETLILAKDRLAVLDMPYDIVAEKTGASLTGAQYTPLFATLPMTTDGAANAYRVYTADFVSTTDGTGLVHIAPAFGEDDSQLGAEAGLPPLFTVDTSGLVTADVPGKGKFFKDADADISADLKVRGLLLREERHKHSYPFCWRCGTAVLYYAKNSWYIRMSQLRERLVANNAKVNWIPSHIRDGRFGEWLREAKDWALSRERYWGTPLPIWICTSCGQEDVVGSFAELEERRLPKNTYVILRHGEAEQNVKSIVSSFPETAEFHLTEKGKSQIEHAAKALAKDSVDLLFSSDLLRAKETADIVSKAIGVPVKYDERLREINLGEYNGRAKEEYDSFFTSPSDRFEVAVPGGESLNDVRRRMVAFVKEMEGQHAGKKIVIVGHGDPLWMIETAFAQKTNDQTLAEPLIHFGETKTFSIPNKPHDELGQQDAHRPFVDEVRINCNACGNQMRRIPDVADVWFDSGAMPFAQWHYPFENKDRIDLPGGVSGDGTNFPADFICEGLDQTRGWFYTLLAVSIAAGFDVAPYKNVICLGLVVDAKGQKMSKSKGNAVEPFAVMEKYGADAVRMHLVTVNQPGELKRFDEKALDEVTKKTFLILWNVASFYELFAPKDREKMEAPSRTVDKWLIARLAKLVEEATRDFEEYNVVDAGRRIAEFITELSTWYVRRSRETFKGEGEPKRKAVAVLGYTLETVAKLLAPITPFVADALYARVGGPMESVHLDAWPTPELFDLKDPAVILAEMDSVKDVVSGALERRAAAKIPVRQALSSLTVMVPFETKEWMEDIIAEEVNVHDVLFTKGEFSLELDTAITPQLQREGAARELVRTVNDTRKKSGMTLQDRAVITLHGTDEFWVAVVEAFGERIEADTLSNRIVMAEAEAPEKATKLEVYGHTLSVEVEKA